MRGGVQFEDPPFEAGLQLHRVSDGRSISRVRGDGRWKSAAIFAVLERSRVIVLRIAAILTYQAFVFVI